MPYRLIVLGAVAALLLAGCVNNQEVAEKNCSGTAGAAHDQCVAKELDRLAKAQQVPGGGGGGGGGGY